MIYLDFDGQTISGTGWSSRVNLPSFDAERFSLDASATFSTAEQEVVQRVWQQVAEDFGPFDVDVTTQDPGDAVITRSGLSDLRFGTRALITNTSTVASTCGCAGSAFIGSFDEPNDHAYYQPALIFSPTSPATPSSWPRPSPTR